MEGSINAVRAEKNINVPVVMTRGLKIVPRVRARSPAPPRLPAAKEALQKLLRRPSALSRARSSLAYLYRERA